jgi:N-acetylglucosamine-6-sulfatase
MRGIGQDRKGKGESMKRKMNRSTFLLGVGGAAALVSLRLPSSGAAQTGRRNVLWVVDDDHPPYMMSPLPVTRHKIRDPGTNFTSGSTDIPLCGPARVSLLTGLSVTTHECDTNGTWPTFEGSPRGLGERTVARHLKDAGYTTGHFGKYINAHSKSQSVPAYWDRWCEALGDGSDTGGDTSTPNRANIDGEITDLLPGILSAWSAEMCAEFIRDRASKSGPFFAQYCPTIPHSPYTPSEDSEHLYDGQRRSVSSVNEADVSDKPKWMDKKKVSSEWYQEAYEGKKEELADLDSMGIRPILEALEATGQLANTVIFFTSDNGYMLGEHRLVKKDQPYWESSEVPFFVKGPGIRKGASSALVNHTDLMPTTCEIAGINPSTLDVDGRSMLANLGQGAFTNWRRRMLVTGSADVGPELNPGGSNDPSGRWWLLREGPKAFILRENGAKELYRMGTDPYQRWNKARTADPALIERLTDTVKAMRQASGQARRRLEAAP